MTPITEAARTHFITATAAAIGVFLSPWSNVPNPG
jgi:hypothetical protein